MKTKAIVLMSAMMMAAFICFYENSQAQSVPVPDSLGLPGDNLNLFAVLDLFQQSKTLEDFEKQINLEDSKVNNLDLNDDNKTDYIRVIDNPDGLNHAIVLQVPVSEKENQDVAVIYVEKDKDGKFRVQIIGNEDLYGKDYIIEPNDDYIASAEATPSGATHTETRVIEKTTTQTTVYVNVSAWPVVNYIYTPAYTVYISPWNWYYYPSWWSPWAPWYWRNYYGFYYPNHHHWHGYYNRPAYYRNPDFNNWYGARSSSSPTVKQNRNSGVYTKTYKVIDQNAGPGKRVVTPNPGYKPVPANQTMPLKQKSTTDPIQKSQYKQVSTVRTNPSVKSPSTKQPLTDPKVSRSSSTRQQVTTTPLSKPSSSKQSISKPPVSKSPGSNNQMSKPPVSNKTMSKPAGNQGVQKTTSKSVAPPSNEKAVSKKK